MTQEQFNTIVKLIQKGAPALADELVGAFQGLVVSYQKQAQEIEELTKPKPSEDACEGGNK